jgi:hypothetical protein
MTPHRFFTADSTRGSEIGAEVRGEVLLRAGKGQRPCREAQRQRLVSEGGQLGINLTHPGEKYGYDTKYAMHM